MPFLQSLEQVRAENWSKQYLWDLHFPDPLNVNKLDPNAPQPSGITWFPAVDVEEGLFSITSNQVNRYISSYKFPQRTESTEIQVTFIEFADHRVSKWLQAWKTNMFPREEVAGGNRQYVGILEDVARECIVQKLWAHSDRVLDNYNSWMKGVGYDLFQLRQQRAVVSTKDYLVYPEGEHRWHGSGDSATELITQTFVIVGT